MYISQATLDGLRTTFDLKFREAYEATEVWYDKISTTIPSKSKSNTYGWAANSVSLREWLGPRVIQNLQEHAYVLPNKRYEGTIQVKREDIEDDDLGIVTSVTVPSLGEATRKHPDTLLASLLAANPNGFDAVSFFNTAHPNYNITGSGATTYSNDINLSTPLDGDTVAAVFATMAGYIGENGLPLKVRPNIIMVPPQLEREALVVMNSTTYAIPKTANTTAATVDNPMRGWAQVMVVEELAAAPTVCYFIDARKAVRPFVYQPRVAAELVARQNPQDPKVFDEDIFTWGVRVRENVGVSLPFLCARLTVTG